MQGAAGAARTSATPWSAARALFTASCRLATGTLVLSSDDAAFARLELQRGFVYAIGYAAPEGPSQTPEENLRRLLKRAASPTVQARFDDGAAPTQRGRCTPFHPAQVVRNHVEAELPDGAGRSFRVRAGGARLRLTLPPHASCLGADEKRLVSLLAVPRTVAELDGARVALPQRTEKLLAFLAVAELLALDGAPADERTPYQTLELPEGAPLDDVRRSYRRLARDLHPDLHQAEAPAHRRALEEKLVAVTAAYRLLVP